MPTRVESGNCCAGWRGCCESEKGSCRNVTSRQKTKHFLTYCSVHRLPSFRIGHAYRTSTDQTGPNRTTESFLATVLAVSSVVA